MRHDERRERRLRHLIARCWAEITLAVLMTVAVATISCGEATAQQPVGPKPASNAAPPAAAAPAPAVMIVFDGSGSMWGRLDGDNRTNKLTVAREALRQSFAKEALAKPGVKTRVGLASFGHRRKADCGDAEVVAAPEAGDRARIMESLDKLNPRGKGPVAGALREAAKALLEAKPGAKPASIVIINDNADNCQQDICAAADEIAKAQPGLAIHAIGIALEPDEAKRMACVARGGGKFTNAEDADKLTAAIDATMLVVLKAPEPAGAAAAAAASAKVTAAAKAAVSPQGAPGVSSLGVSARLGANGPPIETPLHWRIARAGETTPLIDVEAPQVLKPVPAGDYDVDVRVGLVHARQKISVPAGGPASAVVSLDAGHVRYGLQNGKTAEAVAGAVVSLLPVGADGKVPASQPPIYLVRAAGGDLYLAPGAYMLAVSQGTVRREVKIDVAAGTSKIQDVQLGTGRLAVFAQGQEGGPPLDGAIFIVAADDPDAPQGLREVARSGAAQPEFVLPTGTYQVTARLGTTEVRQRIAVGAGDLVKAGIVLGLGRVQVTHANDKRPAAGTPAALTRVSRLDGSQTRVVATATGENPSFTLPAGRYRVESAVGEQNARVAADLDLKPGTVVTVAMRIDIGQVSMRPANAALLPSAGDTLWEIRDARGQIVWRTIQPEAKALLLPGRYTIRSDVRGRSAEQTVDVAAGETRTVGGQQ